ncbi:MAG: hypothetical protein ABR555_17215 [Pyrinomonadaceae bacterium]
MAEYKLVSIRSKYARLVFESGMGVSVVAGERSTFYTFPDFEPIIERFVVLRSAITADYETVQRALPFLTQAEVRLGAFAHLHHTIDSAMLSLHFIDNYLLPVDNEWWSAPKQQSLFGSFDDWYKESMVNSFNNGSVKYAVLHQLFGKIENTFRHLLRKLDPSAANNATLDIKSVFEALCGCIGNKPAQSSELLKLLRLSRNTIHNNGVFYSNKQTDDVVTYNDKLYEFKHAKPVNFINWHFLIDRMDDVRQLFSAVINDPLILGIKGEIPDMFEQNRNKVAAGAR